MDLQEPHDFKVGDDVIVKRRDQATEYHGKIYRIENLPINRSQPYPTTDHFYIQFPLELYPELLQRGSPIIYKNRPETVGAIIYRGTLDPPKTFANIYIQYYYTAQEAEIDPQYINAALIWRIGYSIEHKNNAIDK